MSSTPSVRIAPHQRYHDPPPHFPSGSATSAMAIPRVQERVPPPLPPPRLVDISGTHDPGWRWGNDPNGSDFGRAAPVKPGSSLLGAAMNGIRQEKEYDGAAYAGFGEARRGSSISTVTLDRDHEMPEESRDRFDGEDTSNRPTSNGLQSERQLGQWTLEESSQTYDKQLLSRIGGPNTPKRQSISYSSNGEQGPTDLERRRSSLHPLSVPASRHNSVDSPLSSRLSSASGISPGSTVWQEYRVPENSRAAASRHHSLTYDESGSHRGSYDHSMFVNDDYYVEDSQMSGLHLHDRSPGSPKAGSKRRASSPPRDLEKRSSISSISGQAEVQHRLSMQHLPTRTSPVSRFHPNHSSISSASSFAPRHGSLGSSLGVSSIPSSATSYGSGRVSPSSISPAIDQDFRNGKAFNPSPILAQHQRTMSESSQSIAPRPSAESAPHSRTNSVQMPGAYMCECCPKKPRKFVTEEGLRAHESEKQYSCAYCNNRFKNKNEAERHQNSLHLRRHSWSCAALSGIEAAFHESSNANGTDACGYCGDEFPNPPQWDLRAEHLNRVHKFGECNQTKKFFRADHFRQHLKHSHSGSSGKWTNQLENACMKDEPPPEKRVVSDTIGGNATGAPPALMVTTTGLSGSDPAGPATIEETAHE